MNVGLRYLIAGARCNIGLKAGRSMFEAPEPGLQGGLTVIWKPLCETGEDP